MPAATEPGAPAEASALLPPPDYVLDGSSLPDDWHLNLLRRVTASMMEVLLTKSPKTSLSADIRARDIRTIGELCRIVERLETAARRREGKRAKPKRGDDHDIKQALMRRLDQLLAAGDEGGASGESQP